MPITTSRPWRPALGESIAIHIGEVDPDRRSKYGGTYPVLIGKPFDPDTGVYADHEVAIHAYHVDLRRKLEAMAAEDGLDVFSRYAGGYVRIRITYFGLVEKHSPKHGCYVMHAYQVEPLPDREG